MFQCNYSSQHAILMCCVAKHAWDKYKRSAKYRYQQLGTQLGGKKARIHSYHVGSSKTMVKLTLPIALCAFMVLLKGSTAFWVIYIICLLLYECTLLISFSIVWDLSVIEEY